MPDCPRNSADTNYGRAGSCRRATQERISLNSLPVLILHGAADQNTKPSGSQHSYDKVGSVDKTLKLYAGGFHDLLNDLDKSVVMQDIQDWIGARLLPPWKGRPQPD